MKKLTSNHCPEYEGIETLPGLSGLPHLVEVASNHCPEYEGIETFPVVPGIILARGYQQPLPRI